VAAQLSSRLRESDTLARIGGDEFVALLEDVGGRQNAESIARELIALVSRPTKLSAGHSVTVGLSVGISLYPDNATDTKQLMSKADEAMYRAKEAGRNTLRFSA
jgi:diguanylate cyclase (GGDEF)-like protein